jgi:hypothetical protein
MCASPSLRIMLWPISVFISPAGWCEENTSIRFSWVKMSSRRVKMVEPSCGTNAIGASRRICFKAGYGSAQKAGTSMLKCGADDMAFPYLLVSVIRSLFARPWQASSRTVPRSRAAARVGLSVLSPRR